MVWTWEEDIEELMESGDVDGAFKIYEEHLTKDEFELDEDGELCFMYMTARAFFKPFNKGCADPNVEYKIDSRFTETHQKALKDMLKGIIDDIYDRDFTSWDMRTNPRHYLPD